MLPTEEEKNQIIEAQMANTDIPLGNAEQFLQTLATIVELEARLKLWLFKLDFDNVELVRLNKQIRKLKLKHSSFDILQEIAEPLMDLKVGIKSLKENVTLRRILEVLLAVGNYLNGTEVNPFHEEVSFLIFLILQSFGFQLEYLSKVVEVKDTTHKHSLLYHVCNIVCERYPETTDLYSDMGHITRCSKVNFVMAKFSFIFEIIAFRWILMNLNRN